MPIFPEDFISRLQIRYETDAAAPQLLREPVHVDDVLTCQLRKKVSVAPPVVYNSKFGDRTVTLNLRSEFRKLTPAGDGAADHFDIMSTPFGGLAVDVDSNSILTDIAVLRAEGTTVTVGAPCPTAAETSSSGATAAALRWAPTRSRSPCSRTAPLPQYTKAKWSAMIHTSSAARPRPGRPVALRSRAAA